MRLFYALYIKSDTSLGNILYNITTKWLSDLTCTVRYLFLRIAGTEKVELTGKKPMALYICKHLGMDCSFDVTGTTDHEIMRKFIDHADSAHNMNVLTADVIYRVQKAIKK